MSDRDGPGARSVRTSAPMSDIHFGIDRFSHFQGVLRLAGHAFSRSAEVQAIELLLGDGQVAGLGRIRLPSVDLAGRHGRVAVACRFDETLVVGEDIAPLLSARLRIRLSDGREHLVDAPGSLGRENRVEALFDRFKSMVCTRPPGQLLEVGSRARMGVTRRDWLPEGWHYTGMDVVPGPNVDVVGDIHLASSFLPAEGFDAVMSHVVFEHLMMPWKAAVEINRVMRTGGVGAILAPQTWSLHEEPCDYFRFSRHAWQALFNAATGFEIIEAQHDMPAYIVAQHLMAETAFRELPGMLSSGVLFRKTGPSTVDWPVDPRQISDDRYPVV